MSSTPVSSSSASSSSSSSSSPSSPAAGAAELPPPRPRWTDPIAAGRALPWLMVIAGLIGLIAAFDLTVEKIDLLKDPNYVPSCSINPILSCGSVMKTWQASAFGFLNSLMGIVGFSVVLATGAGMLARARFARWYWAGMQVGVVFAIAFIHWLIVQSLYEIGALCPYCMVVWTVTIALFWYVTLHNLSRGVIPAPAGLVRVLREFHWIVPVAWYLVVIVMIGFRFWSYWQTLF